MDALFATAAIRLVTLNVIVSLIHLVVSVLNLAIWSVIAMLRKRVIQTRVNPSMASIIHSRRKKVVTRVHASSMLKLFSAFSFSGTLDPRVIGYQTHHSSGGPSWLLGPGVKF